MEVTLKNLNVQELSNQDYLMYVLIIESQDNYVFPITKNNMLNIPVNGSAVIQLDFSKVISVAKYKTSAGHIFVNSNYLFPKTELELVKKGKSIEFRKANESDSLKENEISIMNKTDMSIELSFQISGYYTFAVIKCPLKQNEKTTIEFRNSIFLSIGDTNYFDSNVDKSSIMRNTYTTWTEFDLKSNKDVTICCNLDNYNTPNFYECGG